MNYKCLGRNTCNKIKNTNKSNDTFLLYFLFNIDDIYYIREKGVYSIIYLHFTQEVNQTIRGEPNHKFKVMCCSFNEK